MTWPRCLPRKRTVSSTTLDSPEFVVHARLSRCSWTSLLQLEVDDRFSGGHLRRTYREIRQVLADPGCGGPTRFLATTCLVVDADRHRAIVCSDEVVRAEALDVGDEALDLALVLDERVDQIRTACISTHGHVHGSLPCSLRTFS